MKKNLFISTSFLLLSLLFINATSKELASTYKANFKNNTQSLTKVVIEKQLGRKLNFKERVAWFVAKKELKKLYATNETKEVNTNAIIGLIFAHIFPPIGIIFCLIALSQINKNPEKYSGKGLAKAVLIISIVETVLLIVAIIALSSLTFPTCTCNWFDIR